MLVFISFSDLYETTLNAVYPSEECYGKMEEEARMLEKEHEEMNEKLAEVHSLKEQYNQLDQQPVSSNIFWNS